MGMDVQKNSENTEKEIRNFRKLLEINSLINSTLDIGKLLNIIMEIIKDIMNTEASTLFLYEEQTKELVFKVALGEAGKDLTEKNRVKAGQGIAGWVAENKKGICINNVYEDERFDPQYDKITGFNSRAILCIPLLFKGKLIGVIQAINPKSREGFDENDMQLFSAFAEQAVLAVQNAIFFQNALEEERIKNEIIAAQSFHKSLLPAIEKIFNGIQIAAKSSSAREVGGEFYDISCFDDNTIGIVAGDTHTKGLAGALNASILLGAVKGLSSLVKGSPGKLVKHINNALNQNLKNISIFCGLLFPGKSLSDDTTIHFVNEGFVYPILIRNRIARYLKFTSGYFYKNNEPARKVMVKFKPGDFFVIITDGMVNLKNRGAQNLGLKRIMDHLSSDFNTPQEIIDTINKLVDDFIEGLERREDITIIALKIKGQE